MRILELFGGYGSQALALENLGIDFTSDLCEIDKYAIQAYNQLHGQTFNYGDICSIDETKLPYYDLITYSSPCQDFSIAGKQAGGEKGSGTRSSLLWECERIIRAVKPKYLLMENVKALTSEKFMPLFAKWVQTLESIGYRSFWKVLNAKDYGVPQNRERVFVVSILGGGQYQFPEPIPLKKRLKDILEPVVDEKYYISRQKWLERIPYQCEHGFSTIDADIAGTQTASQYANMNGNFITQPNVLTPKRTEYGKQVRKAYESGELDESRHNMTQMEPRQDGVSNTITTVEKDNYLVEPTLNRIGGMYGQTTRWGIYDDNGLCPTMTASMGMGGGFVPMVKDENPTLKQVGKLDIAGNDSIKRVYDSDGLSPTLTTMEGGNRQPKITEMFNPYNKAQIDDVAPTQTTNCNSTTSSSAVMIKYNNCRIRKLTPRECWRLMGVRDEQFDKLHDISDSQLYKMAGNSIVVDVLMGIFRNLFIETEQKGQMVLL